MVYPENSNPEENFFPSTIARPEINVVFAIGLCFVNIPSKLCRTSLLDIHIQMLELHRHLTSQIPHQDDDICGTTCGGLRLMEV